jgi:hypothetical protein
MPDNKLNDDASATQVSDEGTTKTTNQNTNKPSEKNNSKKSRAALGSKSKGKKTSAKTKSSAKAPYRLPRQFPAVTLEEALKIPNAIKTKNGGNPWAPEQIGYAVGMSAKRTEFFYLAGGAVSYGLTIGGWKAPKIELASLGREIVYAPNATVEHSKKIQAFLSIEVFAKVLEHYKGSDLPEMKYLGNTLEGDFGIPPEQHKEFSRIFQANCNYLNIQSGFVANLQNGKNIIVPPLAISGSTTVTLAEPDKNSNLIAFVIMPFVEKDASHADGFFQEVLRSLITPAARDAGFIVKTATRHGSDVIQSTIINDLLEADLVIADLTEHNPNVLFELGVRMANDKPICLIKASGTGQIFDVDNLLRVYPYSSNLWASTIEKDLPSLTDHIKGAWETRNTENTYMKILRRGVAATSQTTFDAFPITIRG